jgi:hypothetical protein
MNSAPCDLIQQAVDILSSDSTSVRITTQASARMGGGVARWDGSVVAITTASGAEQLVLSDLRPAGEPADAGARNPFYIPFNRIIDIESI